MIWLTAQLWPAALLSLLAGFALTWFTVVRPADEGRDARRESPGTDRRDARRGAAASANTADTDDEPHAGAPATTPGERGALRVEEPDDIGSRGDRDARAEDDARPEGGWPHGSTVARDDTDEKDDAGEKPDAGEKSALRRPLGHVGSAFSSRSEE